ERGQAPGEVTGVAPLIAVADAEGQPAIAAVVDRVATVADAHLRRKAVVRVAGVGRRALDLAGDLSAAHAFGQPVALARLDLLDVFRGEFFLLRADDALHFDAAKA